MKSTDTFKNTIKKYLDTRAEEDPLFAVTYKKESKNIDDCCTYILNTVKNSGCAGFTDDEVYGMAVHYYDEDKIEVGKTISANVVVNHTVELTEEELAEAREKAKQMALKQAMDNLAPKKQAPIRVPRKEVVESSGQVSMF